MFYVKNGDIKINIDYDNVYNICPKCGCEVKINLVEVLNISQADLYGLSIFCQKCSKSKGL